MFCGINFAVEGVLIIVERGKKKISFIFSCLYDENDENVHVHRQRAIKNDFYWNEKKVLRILSFFCEENS